MTVTREEAEQHAATMLAKHSPMSRLGTASSAEDEAKREKGLEVYTAARPGRSRVVAALRRMSARDALTLLRVWMSIFEKHGEPPPVMESDPGPGRFEPPSTWIPKARQRQDPDGGGMCRNCLGLGFEFFRDEQGEEYLFGCPRCRPQPMQAYEEAQSRPRRRTREEGRER